MRSPADERRALEIAVTRLDRMWGRLAAAVALWLLAAPCFAVDVWLARYGIGAQLAFAPVLFGAFFAATALTLRVGD